MTWLIFTLVAMLLWAVVNIIDKHVVDAELRDEVSVTRIAGGMMGVMFIVVSLLVEPNLVTRAFSWSAFLAGVVYSAAIWFYYYVMRREEVSRFVPAIGLEPIFASAVAFFLFNERYGFWNYFGMFLAICGVVLISYKKETPKVKSKHLFVFIVVAVMLFVARNILVKLAGVQGFDFWTTMFWLGVGSLSLPFIFSLMPHPRLRSRGWQGVKHLALSIFLSNIGFFLFAKAITMGSVSLASAILATKPLLVFIIVLFLSKFTPKIICEPISRRVLGQKLLAIIIIVVGGILIVS